eukprot:COSAG02_NODE_3479_length_6673_cov_3.496197_7_plen_58_part_00
MGGLHAARRGRLVLSFPSPLFVRDEYVLPYSAAAAADRWHGLSIVLAAAAPITFLRA